MPASIRDRIGGIFPPHQLPEVSGGLLAAIGAEGLDIRHTMSGRCAIMLCIWDWMRTDTRRVAYLPAYTCETVSGCFYKCGYRVLYYDVDRQLCPQYDEGVLSEISLFLAVGYYGFSTFEEGFATKCRERGIGVITDATHSVFSVPSAPAASHYVAASLRKWLPVPSGGIAIKRDGDFAVEPSAPHDEHLRRRHAYFELCERAVETDDAALAKRAEDTFWSAEMLLREVYEAQGADEASLEIIERYPAEELRERRRQNFSTLLRHLAPMQNIEVVFPTLPKGTVPSHFTVYVQRPAQLQELLRERGISSTPYWPVPPFIETTLHEYPGAQWVYAHVLSLPCDQRYGEGHMRRVARALAECDGAL